MKKIFTIILMTGIFGCASAAENYTVANAEAAGFKKIKQKMYQMVGATDGWKGTWNGETVELYQYKNEDVVNKAFFEPLTQPGNLSGWAELCYNKNMAMISKGKKACPALSNI